MREVGKNWIGSYLLIGVRQRYIRTAYVSANCEAGRTVIHSFEIASCRKEETWKMKFHVAIF